jgi:hypothetical protein
MRARCEVRFRVRLDLPAAQMVPTNHTSAAAILCEYVLNRQNFVRGKCSEQLH